jgi:hypothetical protein
VVVEIEALVGHLDLQDAPELLDLLDHRVLRDESGELEHLGSKVIDGLPP